MALSEKACSWLEPPALPRYRDRPRSLPGFVYEMSVFAEVTWLQGSEGTTTSRFAVLGAALGKEDCHPAQDQARATIGFSPRMS